jgi:V8-like Glu-specific endopeptidase
VIAVTGIDRERAPGDAGGADYAIIGPHDNRVQSFDTRLFPFNTVCHLLRDFGNGRWLGASGVFVGPQAVVTAAHCLYKHALGRGPRRLLALPGRSDRDTLPFGVSPAVRFYVPLEYLRAQGLARRRFDYGLVVLQRPQRGLTRFMPMRALDNRQWRIQRLQHPLTICGYPGDKPTGTQWFHRERMRKLTPSRLFYTVDTCPGHSGSPIWTRVNGRSALVGVHTSGIIDQQGRPYGCRKDTVLAPPGALNSGVRFTPAVLANLRQLIRGSTPPAMRAFEIG